MHRPHPVFVKEYYHIMMIRSEIKLCKIIRFCPSEKNWKIQVLINLRGIKNASEYLL